MNRIALSLLAGVAALGFASSALSADLIVEAPVYSPGVVDVGGGWDGAFIGVFGGYATGEFAFETSPDFDMDGWLLGVNAGANFTLTDGIVAGIVGDIAWADITDDSVEIGDDDYTINWVGSVRGRLGFDGGMFMPYLTAGLAFANADYDDDSGDSDSNTHIGWTAGAGIEFMATDDLSIDLAYRYSDYGAETYFDDGDLDFNTHQVTLGLNWHF